jgi:hypothetical protein
MVPRLVKTAAVTRTLTTSPVFPCHDGDDDDGAGGVTTQSRISEENNEESLGILSPTDMRSPLPSLSASVNSSCGWNLEQRESPAVVRTRTNDDFDDKYEKEDLDGVGEEEEEEEEDADEESASVTITTSTSGISSMKSRAMHDSPLVGSQHSTPVRSRAFTNLKSGINERPHIASPIKTPLGSTFSTAAASPVKTFTLDADKLREIEALTSALTTPPLDTTFALSSSTKWAPSSELATRTESLLRSSRPVSAGHGGRRRRRGVENLNGTVILSNLATSDQMGGSLDGTFTLPRESSALPKEEEGGGGHATVKRSTDITGYSDPRRDDICGVR